MPVRNRRQKGLKVSNFALLLVVFKWYGNEGVKINPTENRKFGDVEYELEIPFDY